MTGFWRGFWRAWGFGAPLERRRILTAEERLKRAWARAGTHLERAIEGELARREELFIRTELTSGVGRVAPKKPPCPDEPT